MRSENLGGGFEVIDNRIGNKDADFVNALKDKKEKLGALNERITKLEDEIGELRNSRSKSRDKEEKDRIWKEEQEKIGEIKRLKKEKRDLLDSENEELDIEEAEIFAEQAVKTESFDEFVDVLEKSGRDDVERLIDNIGIYQEHGRDETLDYIRGDHIIRECGLENKIDEWAEELKEDLEKNTGLPVEPMTETEIETEEKPAEEVVEVGIVSLAEKLGVELDDKSKNGIEELEKIKSGETEINTDNVEKVQLFLREFFSGQIENQKTENEKEKEILEKTKSLYYGVMKSFVERRAELEKGEKREKSPSVKIREGIGLAVKEEVLESEEDLSRAKERIEKLGELKKKLKERVKYLEEEKNQDEAEKVKEKINEINDEIGKLKKKFNEAMAERGIKETELAGGEVLEGEEIPSVETEEEPATVGETVERLERMDAVIERVKNNLVETEEKLSETERGDFVAEAGKSVERELARTGVSGAELSKSYVGKSIKEMTEDDLRDLQKERNRLLVNHRDNLENALTAAKIRTEEAETRYKLLVSEKESREMNKDLRNNKLGFLKRFKEMVLGRNMTEAEAPISSPRPETPPVLETSIGDAGEEAGEKSEKKGKWESFKELISFGESSKKIAKTEMVNIEGAKNFDDLATVADRCAGNKKLKEETKKFFEALKNHPERLLKGEQGEWDEIKNNLRNSEIGKRWKNVIEKLLVRVEEIYDKEDKEYSEKNVGEKMGEGMVDVIGGYAKGRQVFGGSEAEEGAEGQSEKISIENTLSGLSEGDKKVLEGVVGDLMKNNRGEEILKDCDELKNVGLLKMLDKLDENAKNIKIEELAVMMGIKSEQADVENLEGEETEGGKEMSDEEVEKLVSVFLKKDELDLRGVDNPDKLKNILDSLNEEILDLLEKKEMSEDARFGLVRVRNKIEMNNFMEYFGDNASPERVKQWFDEDKKLTEEIKLPSLGIYYKEIISKVAELYWRNLDAETSAGEEVEGGGEGEISEEKKEMIENLLGSMDKDAIKEILEKINMKTKAGAKILDLTLEEFEEDYPQYTDYLKEKTEKLESVLNEEEKRILKSVKLEEIKKVMEDKFNII